MKILIISDIHAFSKERENGLEPSYVKVGGPKSSSVSFTALTRDEAFPAVDIVISPGDLADRADPACIEYAWKFLNSVKEAHPNSVLLATAGNHDLDSRNQASDYDAKGILYRLEPSYPCCTSKSCSTHIDDFERQLWFWARNFYMYSSNKCRFVMLNSSAYHGFGKDNSEAYHGRVSDFTIECIKQAIAKDNENRKSSNQPLPILNILVCHHHLEKDGDIDDKDYSEIKGAHSLVELLSDSDFGRWMVIHGHRHRGRIYQTSGVTGPFVLSAASFGATKDRDYGNSCPNQAHLIELDFEAMEEHSYYPAGQIRSWTWTVGLGWMNEGASGGGLPPLTGFGFRGNLDQETKAISKILEVRGSGVEWSKVLSERPHLNFLDYRQIGELKKSLRSKHNIIIDLNENKYPRYLAEAQ